MARIIIKSFPRHFTIGILLNLKRTICVGPSKNTPLIGDSRLKKKRGIKKMGNAILIRK